MYTIRVFSITSAVGQAKGYKTQIISRGAGGTVMYTSKKCATKLGAKTLAVKYLERNPGLVLDEREGWDGITALHEEWSKRCAKADAIIEALAEQDKVES